MDDWGACDAEAVVAALSVHFRFSSASAVQLRTERCWSGPRSWNTEPSGQFNEHSERLQPRRWLDIF